SDRVAAGLRLALSLSLPPQCLLCREPLHPDEEGGLCARCWLEVPFLSGPLCGQCGTVLEVGRNWERGEHHCGACIAAPPAFTRARAVFAYEGVARRLVTDFKFADGTEAAPVFGRWLARAGADLLAPCDAIVPVPLHYTRRIMRRYNQAALLAEALADFSGHDFWPHALRRVRATARQVGLSRAARQRNVARAFAVSPRAETALQGARIVLVDDVLTTGATLESASKILLRAGAARVEVLTLARVTGL
ncbi:MAG: ComF family protein, partial [Pseudomonadota bacterium]